MIHNCPTCKATHLEMDGCVGESYWCPQCGTLTSWIKEAKTTRTFVPRNVAELERLQAALELERRFSAYCRSCALSGEYNPHTSVEFSAMPFNVTLAEAAKAESE